MRITNFDYTGLDEIESWIERNSIEDISKEDLEECLKTTNISFVFEGINRFQSTLICELKDSYVQQSQRYVEMKDEAYILPGLDEEDRIKAKTLVAKAFDLYHKMSELKAGEFKGRPKNENYLHGIPIEDARYILPLATKTNVSVAMSGNKIIKLFELMKDKRYEFMFNDVRQQIKSILPIKLGQLLENTEISQNTKLISDFYKDQFKKISSENNIVLMSSFKDLDLKVGIGAITSTQGKTPSEVLEGWGEEALTKAQGVVNRVLGYGHDSIAEQARATFGMMCSMVTYHQQLRHRLSENHREEFIDIINDINRPVMLPETIKNSIFHKEIVELIEKFKKFRYDASLKYNNGAAANLLLNCDQIKLVMSANARIDVNMLAERICFNAQWEIRDLAIKKLEYLKQLSPVIYESAVPSCVHGKCKEGKLTCGKQLIMRDKFL